MKLSAEEQVEVALTTKNIVKGAENKIADHGRLLAPRLFLLSAIKITNPIIDKGFQNMLYKSMSTAISFLQCYHKNGVKSNKFL